MSGIKENPLDSVCKQTPHRPIGFRRLLRIRTVAQFGNANLRRFRATVRPDAAN